jgi:hypothetical protein
MSTIRTITDGRSLPVFITAKPALAILELAISGQSVSLSPRQARILAYAVLSAAEEVEAGVQES